jgi:hypothetical protein
LGRTEDNKKGCVAKKLFRVKKAAISQLSGVVRLQAQRLDE